MEHLIHHGDCLEVLRGMPDNSVDAVVTDPPYGLSFMGKKWDYDVPSVEVWEECLRVLKPGGHLLAFAGTRTQHRMAVRIEDAGFEIRDMIAWVYGSGFPKSHNVAIGIDKMNGAPARGKALVVAGRGEREDLQGKDANPRPQDLESYAPSTEAAQQWQGWGTALKPALEPITMARKPLEGTVAANVLAHGTGGINVDGCRVNADGEIVEQSGKTVDIDRGKCAEGYDRPNATMFRTGKPAERGGPSNSQGRWPANLIHDGSDEVVGLFPQAAARNGGNTGTDSGGVYSGTLGQTTTQQFRDTGSASRFFYCAKASKADRDEGLKTPPQPFVQFQTANGTSGKASSLSEGRNTEYRNTHPTVKPTDLMRYLCRLVTPPGGVVLDPFTGSGSTGKAAKLEGFSFIGIEREAEYVAIAQARINSAKPHQPDLFS
jgi:site-specific DNA-methyltransferase (adenine-specific)